MSLEEGACTSCAWHWRAPASCPSMSVRGKWHFDFPLIAFPSPSFTLKVCKCSRSAILVRAKVACVCRVHQNMPIRSHQMWSSVWVSVYKRTYGRWWARVVAPTDRRQWGPKALPDRKLALVHLHLLAVQLSQSSAHQMTLRRFSFLDTTIRQGMKLAEAVRAPMTSLWLLRLQDGLCLVTLLEWVPPFWAVWGREYTYSKRPSRTYGRIWGYVDEQERRECERDRELRPLTTGHTTLAPQILCPVNR